MELRKILHVDDDDDIRVVVQIALEVIGKFEIHQCEDGSSAIEAAREFDPQLLLLDVMMPGMSGQEVWQAVMKDRSIEKFPVIFLTAKADEGSSKKLIEQGALAVITKPFDPMTLADRVLKIWVSFGDE